MRLKLCVRLKNPKNLIMDHFNETHTEKLYFTQFSTRTTDWLLLTFFIRLHNQLSSIHSIMTY